MLETWDLRIRRFCPEDWKDLHEYLSLEDVVRFEPYNVMDEEECKRLAAYRTRSDDFYAVCLKENNKMIGNLYMAKKMLGAWELGYVFNPKYHGKGYATRSAKVLMNYIFLNRNGRRIIANCSAENDRSIKVLERIGMTQELLVKSHVAFKKDKEGNPIWMDTYRYAMERGKWRFDPNGYYD